MRRPGRRAATYADRARFWTQRFTYPPIQLVREARSPLRQRYAAARAGQDLAGLEHQPRVSAPHHPFAVLRQLIGAPNPKGPVWAITMVKNEQQKIEGSVRQLIAGGVDIVVVADNLSTDRTRAVLNGLATELPVVIVTDSEPAHYQGPKMSRLARVAARCGASWIIPFDADELWYGVDEPIAARLRSLGGDAAPAPVFDILPEPGQRVATDPYLQLTRRTVTPVTKKTAFRAHLLAATASGNHSVAQPVRGVRDAVVIRHYPFLGFDDFVRKGREGTKALEATDLPANIGEHWRRWGRAGPEDLITFWDELVRTRETVHDPLPAGTFSPGTCIAGIEPAASAPG
jgi:Glycosyl transferase family 2